MRIPALPAAEIRQHVPEASRIRPAYEAISEQLKQTAGQG